MSAAEQSDDSESDAPSMASPRLPRADVYAIVAAERDPDRTSSRSTTAHFAPATRTATGGSVASGASSDTRGVDTGVLRGEGAVLQKQAAKRAERRKSEAALTRAAAETVAAALAGDRKRKQSLKTNA